jgi:hypothetical protein
VDADNAREVIDRVFRDEGFTLERNVAYDRDGMAFRATGFDPEHRIGYVLADWGNLDEDAVISWRIDDAEPAPTDDPEAIRKWFDDRWILRRMPENIQEEAARIRAMTDGKEMAEAFKKLWPLWHAELLSLQEARKLEAEATGKKEFVAVISRVDERLQTQSMLFGTNEREKLRLLERNVREYIAWARAQGLQ